MHPLTEWALNYSKEITISDNWKFNVAREAYRREYHAVMKERGVDVILCPTYPGVGVLQGQAHYWNYTAIWNILDQPAVVFPTGMAADKNVDTFDAEYKPMSPEDEQEWKACKFARNRLFELLRFRVC